MLWKCWFQNNNLYSKHTKNSKKKIFILFFSYKCLYAFMPSVQTRDNFDWQFSYSNNNKRIMINRFSFFFNVNNRNPFKLFLMSSADLEVQLVQLASNIIITLFWGYFKVITLVTVKQRWHNVGFSMLVLITIKQHWGNVLLSTLFI